MLLVIRFVIVKMLYQIVLKTLNISVLCHQPYCALLSIIYISQPQINIVLFHYLIFTSTFIDLVLRYDLILIGFVGFYGSIANTVYDVISLWLAMTSVRMQTSVNSNYCVFISTLHFLLLLQTQSFANFYF